MKHSSIPENDPSAHHDADRPAKAADGSVPASGRGPNGRFCKGNSGGPGNPFARQVAAMRQEFLKAVTTEDIAGIVRAMIAKAKEGDVAAAKVVLQYTVGKPAQTVDPDRLDEMEWQQWQRERAHGAMDVLTGIGAPAACAMARVMIPAVQEKKYAEFEEELEAARERRAREAERQQRREGREAERKARQAETRARAADAASDEPGQEAARGSASPAPARMAEAEEAAVMSPMGAKKAEEDGQRTSSEARAAAVAEALRMLNGTVNKPEETVRRAANDFDEGERPPAPPQG
jgi:hypothetical protein